jgi:3'-5' exoribonuclease
MQIKNINSSQPVSGRYMIAENQLRTAKNGSNYLAMKIVDSTGELAVKVWDAGEEIFRRMAVGSIIELNQVSPKYFKDQIQLEWDSKNSNAFRLVPEAEINYSEFLPQAPGELSDYWARLSQKIDSVKEPALKRVLDFFFTDREFVARFLRVPAALKRHHAYVGGLVEHTVGVVSLCDAASQYYPWVNRDLLITGAILHDIGKTRTYKIGRGFDGTDEGKLIGHLILGVEMVEKAIASVNIEPNEQDFREALRNNLIHLLVSHHGIMEWGSPIEPLTVEACILHHADNTDAEVTKFLTIIRARNETEEWAPYDNGLGRSIYLKTGFSKDDTKISEEV